MANFNRSSLVLAVNRALWGEVTPQMRMVSARIAGGVLYIRIVVDGAIRADLRKAATRIGAAAQTGDFKELRLDCKAQRVDAPTALTVAEGESLVYQRRE